MPNKIYDRLTKEPFILAGPCAIESYDLVMHIAEKIVEVAYKTNFHCIFKSSFDKANRTSIDSFRGPGLEKGLNILQKVKEKTGLALVTDIHNPSQADPVGEIVDIIQIPAFLCRQTDLLCAAGNTGKIVNIKKAQFLSGDDMKNAVHKVESTGNTKIILTERGSCYGYNNLVVDFRNIMDMQKLGYPIVMDITHSTQKPGGLGKSTGGGPQYSPNLAKAAACFGATGFFCETHPNPKEALCDGSNMLKLSDFEPLVQTLKSLIELNKELPL